MYSFTDGKLVFLDGLTYENAHVDSIVFTGKRYYVTAQVTDKGYLLNGYIEGNFIFPLANIEVDDFPHGLALSKSKKQFAFTCYSTSSVYIMNDLVTT